MSSILYLKNLFRTLSISMPFALIFFDNVAYVARVDGVSMQPTLNPLRDEDDSDNNQSNNLNNSNNSTIDNRQKSNLNILKQYVYDYINSASDLIWLSHWSTRNYQIERGSIVSLISPKNPNQIIIKRVIGIEGDLVVTRRNFRYETIRIPKGHCWVEGDNHSKSMDSNVFGPIAVGLITAQAKYIIWPPKRWQQLSSELPKDRQLYQNQSNIIGSSSLKKFKGTYYNGQSYVIDLKTDQHPATQRSSAITLMHESMFQDDL